MVDDDGDGVRVEEIAPPHISQETTQSATLPHPARSAGEPQTLEEQLVATRERLRHLRADQEKLAELQRLQEEIAELEHPRAKDTMPAASDPPPPSVSMRSLLEGQVRGLGPRSTSPSTEASYSQRERHSSSSRTVPSYPKPDKFEGKSLQEVAAHLFK